MIRAECKEAAGCGPEPTEGGAACCVGACSSGIRMAGTTGTAAPSSPAPSSVNPRRYLKVLLEYSLLQGSIRDGVTMHDLLRSYAMAHMSTAKRARLQREILGATCRCLEDGAPDGVTSYARAHLEHHADDAVPKTAGATPLRHNDLLLQLAFDHPLEWVRRAVASGIGIATLRATARAAGEKNQWLRSGECWTLSTSLNEVDDFNEGARREAWRALRRVEPPTDRSVDIEAKVLRTLVLKGGVKINTLDHEQANRLPCTFPVPSLYLPWTTSRRTSGSMSCSPPSRVSGATPSRR